MDCIISYKMHPIEEYDITEISFLKALCQRINSIHLFGLTTYKFRVLADLDACKAKDRPCKVADRRFILHYLSLII